MVSQVLEKQRESYESTGGVDVNMDISMALMDSCTQYKGDDPKIFAVWGLINMFSPKPWRFEMNEINEIFIAAMFFFCCEEII